ncbi:DNA-binding response OmpR family regulator [Chitinophaga dinghuensis]|uniref:DNA-binding response OmpR family regulator n=1 Tax=Chitinophaga dinghuensis TaxID=1539050 RepID=A0A327VJH0_9BACT|nr:response regulator transcription factor [Chitinophaga dinghuensis]RAJ74004.1 DNA-binding response OmpR family regulator [Chitinophaga dinghuensis]
MNKNPRILLVEDDRIFGGLVKRRLEEVGFRVEYCSNGSQAWKMFQKTRFDVCLLDIVLPGMNGFELARQIRSKSTLVCIIFFSAERTGVDDRITSFEIGGDTYLTKPFNITELMKRILVFLKYSRPIRSDLLLGHSIDDYTFHYRKLKIFDNRTKMPVGKLSPLEAKVIRYFFSRPNVIIRRDELLIRVWGKDDLQNSRSMDVYVTKVRKQIREYLDGFELETYHNAGLRLKVPEGKVIERIAVPLENPLRL